MGKEGVVVGGFKLPVQMPRNITTEIMSILEKSKPDFPSRLITSYHITPRLFWTHQSIKLYIYF
jgi:hypothetical protein